MRPTLRALAEQQAVLESMGKALDHIYTSAGLNIGPFKVEANRKIASLNKTAAVAPLQVGDRVYWDGDLSNAERGGIITNVSTDGWMDIEWDDATKTHVPQALITANNWHHFPKGASKTADVENPAQPIPTPAAEAPSATTADTLGNPNKEDVAAPGGVNANEGVTPAANTSVTENTGPVLDQPLNLNAFDPTKPVAGTTEQRPVSETKTETDVRSSTGDNSSTMFPLEGGPFASPAKAGSITEPRLYASQRLARLQMQAGIAPEQDDLVLAQAIARDASMTDTRIADQIATLSAVSSVQSRNVKSASRNLVPKQAAGMRSTPSFGAGVPSSADDGLSANSSVSDAEFLF